MKKITLLVAILAVGLFFVSCNKEGVYKPKNKIDRVYRSYSYKYEVNDYGYWETEDNYSSSKYVSQIWNWDGKLLKSISYYDSDGDLDYTENYEYDGKRLSFISWGGSGRYVLNYDKGKLSSIESFYGNVKEASYDITHDNGKITAIRVTSYDYDKSAVAPLPVNALSFFIPAANSESLVETMKKISERNSTKDVYTYDIKLEWDGKNVSRVSYINGAYTETEDYTYDNKVNPYCGLFDIEDFGLNQILSKNNITRRVTRDSDNEYDEQEYTYTYDGKVPSMKSYSYSRTYDDYRYSYTYNYYYEYK